MVDRVRPLVLEAPGSGGTQLYYNPVEVDPREDGLDARAFFAQNGTSADATAYLSRATGTPDLTLTDAAAGTKRAQDLVSRVLGAVAAHQSLPDPIHLMEDGGPGDGWASGATLRVTYQGILPLTKTWSVSPAVNAVKIVGLAYTYVSGTPLVATKTWTIFGPTGAVVRTLTDTFTRTGPLLTQVVRTWF